MKNPDSNPAAVFNDMWEEMNNNYALFSLKTASWDSILTAGNAALAEHAMSQNELFTLISGSLNTLKDGHLTLISEKDTATYDGFYKDYPQNFNEYNIKTFYLQNDYQTQGPFIFKIKDSIGYLYYNSFRREINNDDLNLMMNTISAKATKGLIVDVRNNTGGDIENVNKLFTLFISERQLTKYEKFKNGPGHDDFTEEKAYYVSPSGIYYNRPIVLLTNRSCFSACNDFVLYMSYLPGVTIVGDRTGGGGAIPADYLLLNGWKLQYSASMTLSKDHLETEDGISPDYYVNITSIDDADGRDPIIEKAIEILEQ